ncbi:MAG: hypothetical protein ACRDDH_16940, partial [Cetobacterium sp.]|uniref:hypothetical protein n=1 Tax=Cetobacterium sp. TaxID=2071632 RepID=UPI003EE4F4C7
MFSEYTNLLSNKNTKLFLQFKLVEQLLIYFSSNISIPISQEYYENILKSYLLNDKYTPYTSMIHDKFYLFIIEIFEAYKNNKIQLFNSILRKYGFSSEVEEWILKSKVEIISFYKFYLETRKDNQIKNIFSNKFVEIIRIRKEKSLENTLVLQFSQGLVFRIPISGNIIFNDRYTLSEGEFLQCSSSTKLNTSKIISESADLIIVHLNDKFFHDFSINSSKYPLKKGYHFFTKRHFDLILKTPNTQYNHFIILEIVTELFFLCGIISNSTQNYFQNFKKLPQKLFI